MMVPLNNFDMFSCSFFLGIIQEIYQIVTEIYEVRCPSKEKVSAITGHVNLLL